jgi:hypothetical protein
MPIKTINFMALCPFKAQDPEKYMDQMTVARAWLHGIISSFL